MSARILVVDDTPLNVKLLAAKLMRDYYVVLTAENGFDALEKAVSEKPDLILLDVMMPDMDGFETCKKLKANEETLHIPVVMVTALSDVADRVHGLEVGADDFLTKPINDVALMARVRSLLRLKMIMDEWRLREATADQLTMSLATEKGNDAEARILLLEDNPDDAETICAGLSSLTKTPVKTLTDMAQTLAEAGRNPYDLVIVSIDLKEEDGLFFCSQLRAQEATRSLPLLLIANDSSIDRVAKGLDLGANDYILRPLESTELIARVRTQLRQKRHHDFLRENYERSLELALVDPLTGAFNRRYLDVHLPRMFARYKTQNRPITVLALDIDFFKKINDTYGHQAGDAVLQEFAARIKQSVRPLDLVARTGGEEFAVIMPECDTTTAASIGNRMREKIAASPVTSPFGGDKISLTTSIGVATTYYETDQTFDATLRRADEALYRAKQNGRNRVEIETT